MIRISQIKLSISQNETALEKKIVKMLRLSEKNFFTWHIVKKSIDARDKNDIKYIYTIDIEIPEEEKILNRVSHPNISFSKQSVYSFQPEGQELLPTRPVIIGSGPAGLFCTLLLAEHGYRPVLIERGEDVEHRVHSVEQFWAANHLNPNSNVQFGEGGAGTFSDGKLNTMVNDKSGRIRKILETFVEFGAPADILYLNKPHIGTDCLRTVVKNMRNHILSLGGEVRFNTVLTDVQIENGTLKAIELNQTEVLPCSLLVLAVGHSARDTFSMLYKRQLRIEKKAFAIGLRMEHPQELISKSQYGSQYQKLPAADYKLTHRTGTNRSVYSFCMCPGGFVVNSSSEEGHTVVNGMSNHARNERNANSAIIVSITPEDFTEEGPLAGVEFQRKWESLAFQIGQGKVPFQLFGDFMQNRQSSGFGKVVPNLKGSGNFANLSLCLPLYVTEALKEGICAFDQKIRGFAMEDAVLSGVETRTSSPVRILRDEKLESNISGIYPCGEGAGYAGGITSAAIDGIKVFEAVTSKYHWKI